MVKQFITEQQLIDKLEDKPEFCIKTETLKDKTFNIYSYNVAFKETFQDNIDREFRGITFNNGNIVSLPYNKFFNIGENVFSNPDKIKNREHKFIVTVKMDGSMISPVIVDDTIFFKTKKSFYSDVAAEVNENKYSLITKEQEEYIIRDFKENGNTHIFEYCSPNNRIVLNYKNSSLNKICSRNIYTGKYNYTGHNVSSIIIDNFNRGINHFIDFVKDLEDIEGFVLYDTENNELYKIKSNWYCDLHRIMTDLSDKKILELIINDKIDDIIAIAELNQHDLLKEKLENIFNRYKEMYYNYKLKTGEIWKKHNFNEMTKKDIAQIVTNEYDKKIQSLIFAYSNEEYFDSLIKKYIQRDFFI